MLPHVPCTHQAPVVRLARGEQVLERSCELNPSDSAVLTPLMGWGCNSSVLFWGAQSLFRVLENVA